MSHLAHPRGEVPTPGDSLLTQPVFVGLSSTSSLSQWSFPREGRAGRAPAPEGDVTKLPFGSPKDT